MKKSTQRKTTKQTASKKTTKQTTKRTASVGAKKVEMKGGEATPATKSVLVRPNALYTKDEVRSILGLSKGTALTRRPGMNGRGKIAGSAVIAYLGSAKRVKAGRRYASGAVAVVAR